MGKKESNISEVKSTKAEVVHIAGTKPDDGRDYLTTFIGFARGASEKYEIYLPIPKSDEDAKADYDCTIDRMVEFGVRLLSTHPDYKSVGFNEDGSLKEGGHKAMQAMADNYKVGQRAVGTGVTSKAKKLDSMIAQYGAGSQEDFEAKLAKMAELEAKGLI